MTHNVQSVGAGLGYLWRSVGNASFEGAMVMGSDLYREPLRRLRYRLPHKGRAPLAAIVSGRRQQRGNGIEPKC